MILGLDPKSQLYILKYVSKKYQAVIWGGKYTECAQHSVYIAVNRYQLLLASMNITIGEMHLNYLVQ